MALAALIGAYEECDEGGLRALLPLAGRALVDSQIRAAAAKGASPIVLLVDEPPQALVAIANRLRGEGMNVVLAEGAEDAAARFEADAAVILMADGVVADHDDLDALVAAGTSTIITVPDDDAHDDYERIDLAQRWAGLSLVEGREIGATAAMLGDWDLPSTLLRRMVQAGAGFLPSIEGEGRGPLWIASAADGEGYSKRLLAASKGERRDWVARYLLPPIEDALTGWLVGSRLRPSMLLMLAAALLVGAGISFLAGVGSLAVLLLILTLPLDLVARRVGALRLRAIAKSDWRLTMLWPLSGAVLVALGLWRYGVQGWAVLATVLATLILAEALRPLREGAVHELWLFDRRPAILLIAPFALFGGWSAGLVLLMGYAGASLIWAQRNRRV
ncbi:hypothetical protein [Sphingomicrobium flavum]|uniref:hypothetical protein n=1 Tax=Sphingomicrobium flavum TaxID=1229164 RepID=UPI0021AD69D2|nr:hypothetical protein [Sphingomicrobium flavum]